VYLFSLVSLGVLVFFGAVFARMAWRHFHRNEPMESGGSFGRQFFDRS
jgi:hypothetical protein